MVAQAWLELAGDCVTPLLPGNVVKLNISVMRPLTSSRSGCTAENDNQNRKRLMTLRLSGLRADL